MEETSGVLPEEKRRSNSDGTDTFFLQPSEKSVDKGFLVTELIGFGINSVTGDYSRGAAGLWIENGEIAYPVEEVTVAGNLKDIFRNIASVC